MPDNVTPEWQSARDLFDRIEAANQQAQAERKIAEADLEAEIKAQGGIFAWIFRPVTEFFKAQASAVWSNWVRWFGPLFQPIVDLFNGAKAYASPDHFNSFLEGFVSAGWLDSDDANALMSVHSRAGVFGHLAQVMLTAMLTGKIIGSFTDVIGATIMQKMNKDYSPSVPSAGDVLNVSFIAPELHNEVVDVLKRNGYSEADIKLMFVGRYAMIPPAEVGEMFLRGILDESGAENRLRELGYTDTRIAEIKQLWKRIPTLQDVVRYLAKEAFEPDQIRKFGLMDGFPEEAVEWAAKQGLERKWAEAEWIAHWRDPGLAPYLAAFHREQVSWSDVQEYMRLVEIAPGLQKVIKDTAYNVYTRVDTRRMYALGVMNEEQVFKAYKEMGYDPEKAMNLTKFTVIDVASEDQPITRADILQGFNEGDLTAAEAESLLVSIGFKPDRAAYLVFRAQREKDRLAREQAQKLVQDRYVNNLIGEAECRAALFGLGLSAARVNELMNTWTIQVIKATKLPSKTDLDKMLRAGIINEKTYSVEMSRLGYSETYKAWYLEMAKRGIEE